MTPRSLLLCVSALALAACGADDTPRFVADSGVRRDAGALDAGPATYPDVQAIDVGRPDIPPRLDDVRVYAHTADSLYAIDPRSFTVTRVGDFIWPDGPSQMTDLAINATGEAWGITFTSLYRVDLATARCTFVAPFAGRVFNGLSFIPGGELEPGEVLVAANRDGAYVRVDAATGAIRQLGLYGADTGSSGDLVSVAGGGTFATIVDLNVGFGEEPVEYLARIDPTNGRATRIGPTGVTRTWGVGYWRSRVYGFTEGGAVVTLDITTGRATEVARNDVAWWGAAVTTIAPVAPP
ncbi:MAG: hypothetical protein EPO40_35470 [Myxococcaceae bacterium]|nr:MAG: hypothetical protein EPO40_35470 [Myxococcaceae bacterium]